MFKKKYIMYCPVCGYGKTVGECPSVNKRRRLSTKILNSTTY